MKVGANPLQMPLHLQRKGDALYPCLGNGNKELLRSCDTKNLRHTSFALVMLRNSFTFTLKGQLGGSCSCKNDYSILELKRKGLVQKLISILICCQGNL